MTQTMTEKKAEQRNSFLALLRCCRNKRKTKKEEEETIAKEVIEAEDATNKGSAKKKRGIISISR